MEKKILVTGGAGFIGSHVVDRLLEKGHEVTVLDDLSGGLKENVNPKAKFIQGSIVDQKLVNEITKDIDIIYHTAAYAAEGLSHFIKRFNYTNNVVGSVNLMNAAVNNNVKSFLFTSSMAVYGEATPPFSEEIKPDPSDPYGIAKYTIEMDLKTMQEMFGLNYVILRPHNVYGEKQFLGDPYRNVIGIFMNRIMQGSAPLLFGDGQQTRAFSYIGDSAPVIAEAPFIKAAENQIFNIGAGKHYTIKELAEKVLKVMGSDLKPQYVPARNEVKHAFSTNKKAIETLGFEDKTTIDVGLQRMAEWAKQRGPMEPIVWEGQEIAKNLPDSWKKLPEEYPNAKKRMNAQDL